MLGRWPSLSPSTRSTTPSAPSCATSLGVSWPRTSIVGMPRSCRWRRWRRWPRWACSGSCSPRSGAAATAISLAVHRDRGDRRGQPVAWGSRCRRVSGWGRTRSIRSVRTSRSSDGCPTSWPGTRLGAFGLTEPDAGSDAGATRTRAYPGRGGVGDRRCEVVHHELGDGDHVGRHRDGRRDRGGRSARSWCRRARRA